MKDDAASAIRKYFEGNLSPEALDAIIAFIHPEHFHKRGQSVWLPSANAIEGVKFGYSELSRLHGDLKAKKIGVATGLLIIDLITMNTELLADEKLIYVDEIEGVGTPEDLEIWLKNPLDVKMNPPANQ